MLNSGIPVPDGFVVLSTTFDEFLHNTDLTQEIEAILNNVEHETVSSVDKASQKIQQLIKHAQMPAEIATEIQTQFKKLNSQFVAVRSSATAEDGAENAWAGQLDSFLNTTENDLLEKVQHCWASLFTPRAIFYRFEKGLNNQKISVAVVVQKMVNSEKSGIAFSVHPVTEDPNQLIIEAGFGLGEAIVSGQITPDSYVVTKNPKEIIDINVSNQDGAIYRKEGGGNEWRDIPDKAETQVLNEKEILELSDIILNIENHYGFPCDIEWAYEQGKFYVVQSRPITTLSSDGGMDNREKEQQIEGIIEGFSQTKWHYIHKRKRSPLYTSLLWEGVHLKTKTKIPFDYSVEKVLYLDTQLAIDDKSWEALRKRVNDFTKKNHNSLAELLRQNYVINEEIEEFARSTGQENFSLENLKKLWSKYRLLSQEFGAYTILPLFVESDLEKELKDAVENKYSNPSEAEKIYRILTTPVKAGTVQEEELNLLKLAALKQKGKLKKTDLQKHLENFSWITNNSFDGKFMTEEFLQERIDNVAKDLPEESLKKFKEKIKEHKRAFEKFRAVFSDKERILGVIDVLQEAIYFRSWRTERHYRNAYFLKEFFSATAVTLKLKNADDIFYLTIAEI
ncbi:MAG: hypothetical protein HGA61_01665, partial [Candidatus Moranbacteria bacterium]|nr:hypothetical protein [Candidatus Moranbacteria bacterium]